MHEYTFPLFIVLSSNLGTLLEPRIKGTQMPSTTWCLLFKLFTLKLTENQLTDMLDNETNPSVRAIALLYIRLTVEPKDMWDWFEPYLIDDHEIPVHSNGKTMLLGHFTAMLIEEQKFCDVLLPRIPVPIHRAMKEKLESAEKLPSPKKDVQSSRRERNDRDSRKDRNRDRDRGYNSRSPPRKRRRSRSPDRYHRRDSHRSRHDRYDRDYDDRRERSRGSRDRYDRYGRDYDDRRDRSRGSRDRYDRHDRDSDDRRRDSDRYSRRDERNRRRRSPSPRSPRKQSRSPSPRTSPVQSSQPKQPNPNLEKLKELYGSDSSKSSPGKSIASSTGYGDSLGDDVVRIGF